MIIVYLKEDKNNLKEEPKKYSFKTKFSEITIEDFQKYIKLALEKEPLETKLSSCIEKIKVASERKLMYAMNRNRSLEKKQIEILNKEKKIHDKLFEKIQLLEIEAISIFSTIPNSILSKMERSNKGPLTDYHLQTYIQYLNLFLDEKKLNIEPSNEFVWQSKTDDELEEMKKKGYSPKKIKSYKKTKFKIKNIWEQTTFANRDYVKIANSIVKDMQNDDYSRIIELIAICTVEDSEELKKIRQGSSMKAYLENYNDKFNEIYHRRVHLFKDQKKKMKLTTVLAVRNFFFINSKK